ncbi:MAG: mobility-associated LCxxNW protein [Bacteroidaceae bacterium]|nr:mobility-associated LCxxNW protein [Blautia sp.]MCF0185291.1 mobility-associated LCxxNW protein [Bacteroidaceae bacterium]
MITRCPYDEQIECDLWIEYQVIKVSLEEAEQLYSNNQRLIMLLRDRVNNLESILNDAGIAYPSSNI